MDSSVGRSSPGFLVANGLARGTRVVCVLFATASVAERVPAAPSLVPTTLFDFEAKMHRYAPLKLICRCVSTRVLCCPVALAICMAWPAAAGAQAPTASPRLLLDVPPIVVVVPQDATEPVEQEARVEVSEAMRQAFPPENPVLWSFPAEQESLPSMLADSDTAAAPVPLAVGLASVSSPAPVQIRYEAEPLNEPRRFWIRIPEPGKLKPGAYCGAVVFQVETFRPKDLVVSYAWPVRIYIEGRQVLDVHFASSGRGGSESPLCVGQAASVGCLVHTVGADMALGTGQLELRWTPHPAGQRQPEPILRLPLPAPLEPIDPGVDFERLETPSAGDLPADGAARSAGGRDWPRLLCRPEEWRRDLLCGLPVKTVFEQVQDGVRVGLYEVDVRLPEVLFPGTVTAHVAWQRLTDGDATAPYRAQSQTVTIQPGIGIHPRVAFLNERVRVVVATDQDLGDPFPLMLYDESGQPVVRIDMQRQLAKANSVDGGFRYEGTVTAPRLGAFKVGLVDSRDPGPLGALVQGDLQFRVVLWCQTQLNNPLIAFAGDPPFWWDLWHGESGGWGAARKHAMAIGATDAVELQRVLLRGVYVQDEVTGERRALRTRRDFDAEPELAFGCQGQTFSVSLPDDGEATEGGGEGRPADVACLLEFPAADGADRLEIDVGVGLDQSEKNAARNRLGTRTMLLRFTVLAAGRSSSDPAAAYRTLEIPFRVKVATSWEYNWPGVAIVATLVALALVGWCIHRRVRGNAPPASRKKRVPVAESSAPLDPFDPANFRSPEKPEAEPSPAASPAPSPAPDPASPASEPEPASDPYTWASGSPAETSPIPPDSDSGDQDDSRFAPPSSQGDSPW